MTPFQEEGGNCTTHGMRKDGPWARKAGKQHITYNAKIIHVIVKAINMCYTGMGKARSTA